MSEVKQSEKQQHRRAVLRITGHLIAEFLSPGYVVPGGVELVSGLRDVRICKADYEPTEDYLRLVIESPDLPLVSIGDLLPYWNPEYRCVSSHGKRLK